MNLKVFILTLLVILAVSHIFTISSAWAEPGKEMHENWYDNLVFKDTSYVFEFVRVLAATYGRGADVGETIYTAKRIKDRDARSWFREWNQLADRIYNQARQYDKKGYKVSARTAYLRASNYYRTACFYLSSKEDRERSIATWRKSRDAFVKAASLMPGVEIVKIPYENTHLPAYFLKASNSHFGKKPPLIIVQTGFDGTAEELYFGAGIAALERGYNCLIFEGPGQGAALRELNLHFRPDWEKVITPVVDYALSRPDVDKNGLVLMGISFGGYLAPRGAAFEHRLKACIANGGVYDFSTTAYERTPKELIELLDTNPELFNTYVTEGTKEDVTARWSMENGLWVFGVDTPAEYYKTIKKYNLRGVAEKIKCHMLVIDSESDQFMPGQPKMLMDALTSPKTLMIFTREETAEAHCQMGATAVSNERIFNWIDDLFRK